LALLEASSGFSSVAALVQEYLRVQSALLRAVGRGTTTAEAEKSRTNRSAAVVVVGDGKQETSLEALLSDLLDRCSGLTATVQTEKSSLEEQLSILRAEHAELLTHCESLESVLRSAVHAGPDGSAMDTTGQALLQLVTARRRIAELEADCAALSKSSQQAQQAAEESKASAVRNWAEVRSDVAQLVQHAERAQLDAESALQQQRSETARLVSEARAKEHAAAAARNEAEADVSQLREEAASLSRQLQNALTTAASWETRAKSAEDALEVARIRLQEAKQQQQQQLTRTATDVDDDSTANDGEIKPLNGLQPSVHLSSEDIDKLRRRVIYLESALKELQEHAATSALELIEARAKIEIAEEAAAAHHAASEAAMQQVEIAITRATEAEMKRAALELEYLEQQTLQQQQQLASALPSLPAITSTTTTNTTNAKNREENDAMLKTTLNMPPSTADIPVLRRRLEAALRQIEGLKSLNANLEQQLIANVTSLSASTSLTGGNNSASTTATSSSGTTANRNLADATAYAMIDALQLQMEAMGMMTRKTRQQEESLKRKSLDVVVPGAVGDATVHLTSASKDRLGPVERVVALWKQACATRDEKLEEAARRLQVAGIELGAKESELAAMKQAAKALKKARNEAIAAATDMEKRMREALSCKRSLESQIAATVTGLGDRDLLRDRVSSLEKQYSALKEQANASEMRAVQAERALAAARSTAVATSEQLRRCEEAEGRARAANERASEAERALARHLESHSQQNSSTSLGKSLEAAWSAEQGLMKKIQEMQVEAAGTKAELAIAVKDVEMYAKRAAELQEQLNEAIGALAEQGEALEAVQHALHKEKAARAG
jgi:chromosome segregation ATPase